MTPARTLSPLDRLLVEAQRALGTSIGVAHAERPNPAGTAPGPALDAADRRHAAGLMRINHTGEVCAQALYVGQAAVARDDATRTQLLDAAQEETDHLAWCADRLRELDSRPSLLNPLWYAGSYAIGLAAGLRGDGRSRAILATMKADEARHADHAEAAGARPLPKPVTRAMAFASGVMKAVAYRI